MIHRAVLILLTGFWLAMNVLLWRSEYGQRKQGGAAMPAEAVWQKMLMAPDTSSLTIYHHRKKVGFCHWITSVAQDLNTTKEADLPAEGMVGRVSEYRVQLEGNVSIDNDSANRLRFDGNLKLGRKMNWKEFGLRVNLRPTTWEIHSAAAEQSVHFRAEEGDASFDQVFHFSDLADPAKLARQLGDPASLGWLSAIGLPGLPVAGMASGGAPMPSLDLKWHASHDSVRIGHSSVRAYRLETRLLDRYDIVIFVSRVGEILRVELPDEIVLLNDQLAY